MFGFLLTTFILVCYGLSNMVIYSKGPFHIFQNWRLWADKISPMFGELFSCMMCFPFWAGVLLSIVDIFILTSIVITPYGLIMASLPVTTGNTLLICLFNGILSSASTWLIHNIEEFFENRQ